MAVYNPNRGVERAPREQHHLVVRTGLETSTSKCLVRRPYQSATLLPYSV